MKWIAALFVSLGIAGGAIYSFGANDKKVDFESNQWLILKYLTKHDDLKGTEAWERNPYVQQVRNEDGTLNMERVKELFIERGIMSAEEFDTALATLESDNFIISKKPTASGKKEFERLKLEKTIHTTATTTATSTATVAR
ncbi:MAG: hypothetical protein KBD16_00815 [Candidatus Pacebacteria bacterium]|nr:hypothetical protein [Candidatus Paceibacterota bacterium]